MDKEQINAVYDRICNDVFNCRKCRDFAKYYEWLNSKLSHVIGPHVPYIKDKNRRVDVMIIGIQPGFALQRKMLLGKKFLADYDEKYGYNVTFGSHSGALLRELLEKYFGEFNYYVTNVVKCNARYYGEDKILKATMTEIARCKRTFLYKEISLFKPKAIIVLGREAWAALGFSAKEKTVWGLDGVYIYSPHPAAVQRNYSLRSSIEAAFGAARRVVKRG